MSSPQKQIKLDDNYASAVVISLVKSHLYNEIGPINADDDLKIYFKETRRLKLNDYIFIKSNLKPNIQLQFKVVDVQPESLKNSEFKVDQEHTSLSVTEHPIKDKWIWNNQNKNIKALDSYVDSVLDIINFYKYNHETDESTLPLLLLIGPHGCGKTRIVESVCSKLSLHLFKVNGVILSGDTAASVEKRIEIFFQKSMQDGPCVILIKSFHFIFKFRDLNECNKRIANTFFKIISRLKSKYITLNNEKEKFENWFYIICTSESKQEIDANVESNFNSELEIKSLNENERHIIFSDEICPSMNSLQINKENDLDMFMRKTNGLYYSEMQTLIDFLRWEIRKLNNNITNTHTFSQVFEEALRKFNENRKFKQENRLQIENINWNDIGGLIEIKKIIMDTILLPLNYPHLFTSTNNQLGISRSGILLYGPPGTGKTLLAKAICSQCNLNFISVKGPELLDMYVGQTEANVRNLFQKARMNAPCVLFFDELDSLAPIRGRAGDSGGVMDRVVSQLLTEVDGLDKFTSTGSDTDLKSNQIFLIGATNRPDLIDPSLLRPGRFDKLVYVPIAKTKGERVNIFKALLRKLKVDPNFDIDKFIDTCPDNLTGADFYAITNRARQHALKRIISAIEAKEIDQTDTENIVINEEDFQSTLDNFVPTLNDKTLLDYEKYFSKYSSQNST